MLGANANTSDMQVNLLTGTIPHSEKEYFPRLNIVGIVGHALCSDDGSDGSKLWMSSSSSEQDFLLSCPVSKVDW